MIPSPLLVVTDRHASDRPLAETVRRVLDGGARWIWLRDRDLEPGARRALALDLLALIRDAGGRLTIGGDVALAADIGADGVHLGGSVFNDTVSPDEGSAADRTERVRKAVASARLRLGAAASVGVSAHGLADLRAAGQADYATLSPIFATASKPGYGPALGLDGLREASGLGPPVLALGGVDPRNARACLDAGAAGVAVMGCVMRAADPAAQTRRLIEALRAT